MQQRALLIVAALLAMASPPLARAQAGTIVVLNKGNDTATMVDAASGDIVATMPTGPEPHELALTRDGRTAIGADYGGNTLTVFDVPERRVVRTIDLGHHTRPHGITVLPGDSLVAVTAEASRHVVVARIADGAVVAEIPTGSHGAHMLALTGDGSGIYTSNGRGNSVSALDVKAARHTGTFSVPPAPEAITVTADGNEVWVGSNEAGTVNVLKPSTGEIEQVAGGFAWPYRILITPDRRWVIVPDPQDHNVRFFDALSREEVGAIDFPGAGPQGVFVPPASDVAYLSLSREGAVAVIDLASRTVLRRIPAGPRPDGIVFSRLTMESGQAGGGGVDTVRVGSASLSGARLEVGS